MRLRAVFHSLLVLACMSGSAFADSVPFESKDSGIRLRYPDQFSALPASPPVLLLLRAGTGFPTFNIIAEPGLYDVTAPVEEQEEALLHSYRAVGFTDAKLTTSKLITVSGRSAFQGRLEYRNGDQIYAAIVTTVPSRNKHFILTYIFPAAAENAQTNSWLTSILDSFESPPPLAAAPAEKGQGNSNRYVLAFLLALLLALIFARRFRR